MVAEVVEKRCGASKEAIAQASSARDAEKIERVKDRPGRLDVLNRKWRRNVGKTPGPQTAHRAAKVAPNNRLRNRLFASRGRWRPAALNLCFGLSVSHCPSDQQREKPQKWTPYAGNYVRT